MTEAAIGLDRLQRGNDRYAGGDMPVHMPIRFQRPFAAIVGCADSRVCPELIFGLGQGDIFVIRVAGGIASGSVIGSVEYAIAELGVPLVVVLGHRDCGAVQEAVASWTTGEAAPSSGLNTIIRAIQPVLGPLLDSGCPADQFVDRAVTANSLKVAQDLVAKSALIGAHVRQGTVRVETAVLDLETGHVRFLL